MEEIRSQQTTLRTDTPGVIFGCAAAYDKETTIRSASGDFTEVIKKGAFTRTLKENPDILCLRDHDHKIVLGRTKSGTLKVWESQRGLEFECILPETEPAKELVTLIRRGDVDACSFRFSPYPNGSKWTRSSKPHCELTEITCSELSIVSFPAYGKDATSVDLRSIFANNYPAHWIEKEIELLQHKYKIRKR